MQLQELQPPVDATRQVQRLHHPVDDPDASNAYSTVSVGNLVANIAGPEHRLGLVHPVDVAQPTLDPPMPIQKSSLALGPFLCFLALHSKLLSFGNCLKALTTKAPEFRVFF
jgi:hypothetical protein